MGDCLRPNLGNTPATGGLHYEVFCAWKLALAEVKPSFKAPPQFKAPPSFKAPPPHLAPPPFKAPPQFKAPPSFKAPPPHLAPPPFKAPPQFKASPSFKAPPPHLAIDSRWLPTALYLGHRRGVIVHEFWSGVARNSQPLAGLASLWRIFSKGD